MNTLEAYEKDIHLQLGFLKSFRSQTPIPARMQPEIIFAGSGDSLAASMLAESYSSNTVRSMDPLELYKNDQLMRKKTVYFVSVSGNTISNIKSAQAASNPIAITANPESRLAKSCVHAIPLVFPNSGMFTAGSIGFLSSALTCISLVKKLSIPHAGKIFAKAEAAAKDTRVSNRVFILGNLYTYPLAMYCAAKFYEILGTDAHYAKIEQFSHMELFSAQSGDTVILFEDPSQHSRNFVKHLRSIGLDVFLPEFSSKNPISKTIFFTFYSQLLPLLVAKSIGKNDCHFVLAEKLRSVSNNMIY